MREIKFRAWYSPGMAHPQKGVMNYSCAEGFENSGEALSVFQSDLLALGPGSVNIMQFTGLKDKNGKEIYEGDIVATDCYPFIDDGNKNYVGVVEYDDEQNAQFLIVLKCVNSEKRGISDGICHNFSDHEEQLAIIGNIHQNPDLLQT